MARTQRPRGGRGEPAAVELEVLGAKMEDEHLAEESALQPTRTTRVEAIRPPTRVVNGYSRAWRRVASVAECPTVFLSEKGMPLLSRHPNLSHWLTKPWPCWAGCIEAKREPIPDDEKKHGGTYAKMRRYFLSRSKVYHKKLPGELCGMEGLPHPSFEKEG